MGVDAALFHAINRGTANALFDALMPVVTNGDVNAIVLVGVGLLVVAVSYRSRQSRLIARAWAVFLAAVLAVALGDWLGAQGKDFWLRPRPPLVLDNVRLLVGLGPSGSFPSNHAINTFAALTPVALAYRRWAPWCLLYGLLMGYSRVYVGVHYPGDVAAGAALGLLVGAGFGSVALWLTRPAPNQTESEGSNNTDHHDAGASTA